MTYSGIVKWFNNDKGFGFIQSEGMDDIFVHFTEIIGDGYRFLNEGDKVEFNIVDCVKGKQATNVVVI